MTLTELPTRKTRCTAVHRSRDGVVRRCTLDAYADDLTHVGGGLHRDSSLETWPVA